MQDKKYSIAHVREADGNWDILEDFEAADDEAANLYAEQNYADDPDWFAIDSRGRNING